MSNEPLPPLPPNTPQVLLFGHSGSGKSALLGALLKANETQGRTLRGEVLESSGRLASIRDAVYHNIELERSDTEVTRYVITLRAWGDSGETLAEPVPIALYDCSGKAAESLIHSVIRHPNKFCDPNTKAPVERAFIDSDAIMLLVNGAADDEELQDAFEEFDKFLSIVSQAKATAREVGGFPVLLVLTQCDRLLHPGDTFATWEARVRQQAERAWKQFHAFLRDADDEDDVPSPFLPFGSVDLNVYSVAVRYPKLRDIPAQPDIPYKVAELFGDCFAIAKAHRDRVNASNRRLKWTVRLALAFVALLLLGVITVMVFQPPPGDFGLSERVMGYQANEPEAAIRLAYPQLIQNKQTLTKFQDDPAFISLQPELREFVLGRLKEIDDYEAFRSKLVNSVAPGDTRTLEDLAKVEATLKDELALPSQYGWGETVAGQLRQKWLADVEAIRKAEATFLAKENDFIRRGVVLTLQQSLGGDWRAQVNTLIAEAAQPPAPLSEPLPGSPAVDHSRGKAVTNRVPYEFERVYNARKDWELTRERLSHLRDLGDALGLTTGSERPPAVLVLPEPGAGVDSATLPASRWAALFRSYPRESEDFREWNVQNFPDPIRLLLADRLERSFRTGVRHVHALILAKMNPGMASRDTPTWWRELAQELLKPGSAFADWGRFLHLLARLRDPAAREPIDELASFLRQDKFDIDLSEFNLLLPLDLSLDKVTPAGAFTITNTQRSGGVSTLQFKQSNNGVREGSALSYRFVRDGKPNMTYALGDELRAELPLKVGTQEVKLVWDVGNTRTFQFDRLAREPRIVKPGGSSEPANGVRLIPVSGNFPRLPVLFPELKM
jgi:hypothetical protein